MNTNEMNENHNEEAESTGGNERKREVPARESGSYNRESSRYDNDGRSYRDGQDGNERKSFRPRFDNGNRRDGNSYGNRDNVERRPYRRDDNNGNRSYGERRSYNSDGGNRGGYGERRSYNNDGNRGGYGERRSYNSEGGNRNYNNDGDNRGYGERRSYNNDGNNYGERRSYNNGGANRGYNNDRGGYSNNRGYNNDGNRGGYGERRSYNSDGGNSYGERRPYNNGGERRPSYGNNDRRGGYDSNRNSNRYFDESRNSGRGYNTNRPFNNDRFNQRQAPAAEPVREEVIPDEMRLNRYIAMSGVCSRRDADDLITSGRVKVNGEVVQTVGVKVKRVDDVEVDGNKIIPEHKVYLVLNKPKDFVTTVEDPLERKTVMSLIEGACKERIYPIGRLDRQTTGVLLFTNDGDLSKKLTHPKYNHKKIYHVFLDKPLVAEDCEKIKNGIELEDGFINADEVNYVSDDLTQVGVEIHSGRNRIVRRIFEHLGYQIIKLDRVYFAGITKKNLPRGHWRMLLPQEVNILKSYNS